MTHRCLACSLTGTDDDGCQQASNGDATDDASHACQGVARSQVAQRTGGHGEKRTDAETGDGDVGVMDAVAVVAEKNDGHEAQGEAHQEDASQRACQTPEFAVPLTKSRKVRLFEGLRVAVLVESDLELRGVPQDLVVQVRPIPPLSCHVAHRPIV
ncbi:MAG: hypothetical protein JWN38_247 [Candidatus Saccharibacteria bacterium]|nr:hypothetical protein [Candidatus Saccharibacteria bacterium]